MATKMTLLGVGPRIALAIAPYLGAMIAASAIWPDKLRMPLSATTGYVIAAALGALFFVAYVTSARILLTEFKKGVLITRGPYALSRNPLYASFLLFGIPAAAFAARSWAVLSVALVAGVIVSRMVRREEEALEAAFGDEYRAYGARVGRILC